MKNYSAQILAVQKAYVCDVVGEGLGDEWKVIDVAIDCRDGYVQNLGLIIIIVRHAAAP